MATNNALNNDLQNCHSLPLETGVTGNLDVSHLDTGTGASATTFWRGDGSWATPIGTGIVSVSGTLNRITVTAGLNPVVDISASYVGQSSITTIGTITTGTWNGTPVDLASYVSGNLAVTHLNSGTGASATTFWRGDGTWATPSSGITPAALTRTDDSNVTITLGGTPATALLQGVSLTMGWTGQLSVPRGGTGIASATPYAVLCGGTTSTGALQSVASVGTSGQVLTSNGPGALPTFQAAGGSGRLINVKVITATGAGTYTPTAGTVSIVVETWGAGGGGGGANTGATQYAVGGGGGGGTYQRKYYATLPADLTYFVGTGGTAGANTGGNGGNGGGTTWGATSGFYMESGGGNGGTGSTGVATGSYVVVPGGTNGTYNPLDPNGDVNNAGSCGQAGIIVNSFVIGGLGGASGFGNNCSGQSIISNTTTLNATTTLNRGAGCGGGGAVSYNATNRAGGAGTNGMIIISEYS